MYSRVHVYRDGALVGSCSSAEVLFGSVSWLLSDRLALYVANDDDSGLSVWSVIVDDKRAALCRGLRVDVDGSLVESVAVSVLRLGPGSGVVFYNGYIGGFRVAAAIGVIGRGALLYTLVHGLLALAGYAVLAGCVRGHTAVRSFRTGLLHVLMSLELLIVFVGSSFMTVAIVSGDVPLFFLSMESRGAIASILLYVSLAMCTPGNWRYLVVVVGPFLLFGYFYSLVNFGRSMISALQGVVALTRVSPVEAVLVAPAYYPIVAGLAVAATALAALGGFGERLRPRLTPVSGFILTMASLMLLSIWPVAWLTALRAALLAAAAAVAGVLEGEGRESFGP